MLAACHICVYFERNAAKQKRKLLWSKRADVMC